MAVKNLWGELPEAANIRSPATILREQASLLTQMTKGTLDGQVSLKGSDGIFVAHLAIMAPALDNYVFTVLRAQYPMEMYPVTVAEFTGASLRYRCKDEENFQDALAKVLSSDRIKRVIGHLLSKSRSAA